MPWRLKTFLWCVALLLVFLWGVIAFTLLPLEQRAAPEWGDTVNTVQKAIAGVGIAFAVSGFSER